MREYRLRTDLKRATVDGFALPLGIEPDSEKFKSPVQGYTVAYTPGENDDPDTYAFHVVVSHDKLASLIHKSFDLLPDNVFAIVEIGSRDAYRSTDVYIGQDTIPVDEFREVWDFYEPFLLEETSIAAGANSDEPFVEVFIDQWKGLSVHVPLEMRDEVEAMLQSAGLEEVQQTWPVADEDAEEAMGEATQPRHVLDISDDYAPDVDELLLELRHDLKLELNVDPESNVDDAGRNIGSTLWHALVIVEPAEPRAGNGPGPRGAYMSVWATAGSLSEMERMIQSALEERPEWAFSEIYTIDRVAHDERPESLADLPPARRAPGVHLVTIEPWDAPESSSGTSSGEDRPGAADRD